MKITDLIVESQYTAYHQKLADQLPLGIRTIKQLCDESIKIAIKDLGVNQAGRIFTESFISDMLLSYNNRCLQEGVSSFLGKAAGNVVGATKAAGRGLKNAWADAKQGYAQGKANWDPKQAPAVSSAPTASSSPASGGAPAADPAALRQQAAALNQQADQIEQSAKQPAAPAIGTPPELPAGGKGTEQNFDPQTGQQQQAAPAETPPTGTAPAETPPTGTAPAQQTSSKMTKAQQDAMKAKLQGKRAAGQTTASQTGSGFSDYVAGSQNKLVTNPDGSTSMKKLQRESIDFYSNFLGQKL